MEESQFNPRNQCWALYGSAGLFVYPPSFLWTLVPKHTQIYSIWTYITQEKEPQKRHAGKKNLINVKKKKNFIWWWGSSKVTVTVCHHVAFVAMVISVMLGHHPKRKPCRHYLGNLTKSNRRKLLCEYFVAIISAFETLRTAKDYALHFMHFILAGLIFLCQPLKPNIWVVILIKMITSSAFWNGKQSCWNERLHHNCLKWSEW